MKHLSALIKESLKTNNITKIFGTDIQNDEREYLCQEQLKEEVNDFFEGTIIDPIYSYDYINEMLLTHDYKKLIKAIQKTYGDIVEDIAYIDIQNEDKNTFYIKLEDDSIVEDDKFKTLLDFFNYFIRNKIKDKRSEVYGYYCIEPKYSEKISQDILNKYNNLCYHYTTKKNVDSILKNGLRIKRSKDFRYPNRIYVVLCNRKDVFNPDITSFAKRQISSKKIHDEDGIACMQINLNKLNVDIYKDTTLPDDEAYFLYNNIPKEYIKEIKQ